MSTESLFSIVPVRTTEDLEATVELFRMYVEFLSIDLTFQSFDDELVNMPGKYAPPTGELLLARNSEGEPVGCVGLRALGPPDSGCCEMKRLYIVPSARGHGIGQALVMAIINEARKLGYRVMKLDTLPRLEAALALYKKLGFRETQPYYDTPLVGTIFLAYLLEDSTNNVLEEGRQCNVSH